MTTKQKVSINRLITVNTTSFAKEDSLPLELLKRDGYKVWINPYGRRMESDEIVHTSRDAIGIIAGTERYDTEIFHQLPYLRVISRCGVGLDNVDTEAANRFGIKVLNTPNGPTLAVAELTVGLILNLLRKVSQMDKIMRNGCWEKRMGSLLAGKRVGILGFGRIGQKVGELLTPFGVELAYCDLEPKSCSFKCGAKRFEEVLGWADILTIHLSPSKECNPILGKEELGLMKKGSWLINLSRGGVVDEEALYCALKDGHLSGAAIDVFEDEPYTGRLRELDNVILTPHIGSYAREARIEMEKQVVENLLRGLIGNK